jgi:hypothetical protein
MLKLELKDQKNIKKLLMLNGTLYMKNYNLSMIQVLKSFSPNYPLVTLLPNGSLIEECSVLDVSLTKIYKEFKKPQVLLFKPLLTDLPLPN